MKKYMITDREIHPLAEGYVECFKKGQLSRREFLAYMMSLGVTAAVIGVDFALECRIVVGIFVHDDLRRQA